MFGNRKKNRHSSPMDSASVLKALLQVCRAAPQKSIRLKDKELICLSAISSASAVQPPDSPHVTVFLVLR